MVKRHVPPVNEERFKIKVSDNTNLLRKPYTPPQLVQYGSIRDLTKGEVPVELSGFRMDYRGENVHRESGIKKWRW